MTTTLRTFLALLVTAFFAATASAAHVHFKSDPVFTDLGLQLQSDLSFAGIGNKDLLITVTATGNASVVGLNPAGHFVPGQNKVPIVATSSVFVPKDAIKNGNVSVSLTSPIPATPTALEAGLPNPLWITQLVDVEFTSVKVTVEQGGKIVFETTITL